MKKIVAINYFEQRVDRDWAFAQLQDHVESYFTSYVQVAESDDTVVYDYAVESEYGITLYLRDNNGNIPVVRFKFDNATLSDTDRALTEDELELARYVIEEEHLDAVAA